MKYPEKYTNPREYILNTFGGDEYIVDSANRLVVPFPDGTKDLITSKSLCNGGSTTYTSSEESDGTSSTDPSSISTGTITSKLFIGDYLALDGVNGIITIGIPKTGLVGNNAYMLFESDGIYGMYGDTDQPWFVVSMAEATYTYMDPDTLTQSTKTFQGGDFFIGDYSNAYLYWEYATHMLTIAGDILIAGDIKSKNFVLGPPIVGYKIEWKTGKAWFGGAVISGGSTIGTEGTTADAIGSAINSSGNLITDVINTNLSTLSKQILGDFTFGSSGAIKMITDENNGLWLSPTGILGKKAGITTFGIGIDGSPTFRGEITGGSININSAWHVDSNGNMWWGAYSAYEDAVYKLSSAGAANFSGLIVGTNVGLGTAKQNFTSTPTTPYYAGDLWTGGSTSDIKVCTNTRLTGAYNATDWDLASKYTVGATWGTNLSNIPTPLTAPSGSGLFIGSTNMGYYTGGAWKTYIDNSGNMILGNIAGGGAGLSWNQSAATLSISGSITMTGGSISWASITAPSYSNITGTKPPTDATKGATIGTDLSGGSTSANTINSSGYITNISADSITSGTITGRTLRTASSGARVQIDSSNYIQAYDASYLRVKLDTTSLTFYNSTGTYGGNIYGASIFNVTLGSWVPAIGVDGILYIEDSIILAGGFGGGINMNTNYISNVGDLSVNNYIRLGIKSSNPTTTTGTIWCYNNGGTNQFRGVPSSGWTGSFDMTAA